MAEWGHFQSFLRILADPLMTPASAPRACDVCWALSDVGHLTPTEIAGRGTRYACSACRQHMRGIHCDWMPPQEEVPCQYCTKLSGWTLHGKTWIASQAWLKADEAAHLEVIAFYSRRIESSK